MTPLVLILCGACARARGAHGSHAQRYHEIARGIWRGACDDCGARGSSGDASAIACFHVTHDARGLREVG